MTWTEFNNKNCFDYIKSHRRRNCVIYMHYITAVLVYTTHKSQSTIYTPPHYVRMTNDSI